MKLRTKYEREQFLCVMPLYVLLIIICFIVADVFSEYCNSYILGYGITIAIVLITYIIIVSLSLWINKGEEELK